MKKFFHDLFLVLVFIAGIIALFIFVGLAFVIIGGILMDIFLK
ncbi:hypothetical protein [uncultured Phascolarctobacterium sp.]|nr:hypothetical protein [uncultured Phascolarctobacterium sp.]